MELISIGFIHNDVTRQYKYHKNLRIKIDKYFSEFVDSYNHFKYVWIEGKLYISSKHSNKIKNDIETLLNNKIESIKVKFISQPSSIRFISSCTVKRKIESKKNKKKKEINFKRKRILDEFFSIINNIKNDNNIYFNNIGCFDLEFWENNSSFILEFGWCIVDYKTGERKTTHLIIDENIKYKNVYVKDNRFGRDDSEIVSNEVAIQRFQDEFLTKIDVLIGHGLDNDVRVLNMNGLRIFKHYLDTSDIGAAILYENDRISLERLLTHLRIKGENLHNAANDAECILQTFFKMGEL